MHLHFVFMIFVATQIKSYFADYRELFSPLSEKVMDGYKLSTHGNEKIVLEHEIEGNWAFFVAPARGKYTDCFKDRGNKWWQFWKRKGTGKDWWCSKEWSELKAGDSFILNKAETFDPSDYHIRVITKLGHNKMFRSKNYIKWTKPWYRRPWMVAAVIIVIIAAICGICWFAKKIKAHDDPEEDDQDGDDEDIFDKIKKELPFPLRVPLTV